MTEQGGAGALRAVQVFRRIAVIGGGCYGSWYLQQLGRAWRAGAIRAQEILVVDRRASCQAAEACHTVAADGVPATLVVAEWAPFLAEWMAEGSEALHADAMVPSPLMPHLCLDWLCAVARARWPERVVEVVPVPGPVSVPWQRSAPDARHYVSHADWTCPVNCIEPRRCPATRGNRHWSMPETIATYAAAYATGRALTPDAGGPAGPGMAEGIDRACIFACTHRAYGVGMIDMAPLAAAGAALRALGDDTPVRWLVGTMSHCHGALGVLSVTAP